MVYFKVPAVPVAQPRIRATKQGRVYTPAGPVHAFKAAVMAAASEHMDAPILEGPIELWVSLIFPRPKNRIWKTRPMPREPHVKRPDLDNVLKAIMDALKGIAWTDDTQVQWINARKWVAGGDEAAACYLDIRPMEDET